MPLSQGSASVPSCLCHRERSQDKQRQQRSQHGSVWLPGGDSLDGEALDLGGGVEGQSNKALSFLFTGAFRQGCPGAHGGRLEGGRGNWEQVAD